MDIGILFIGELLLISENRALHSLDSDLFVDGRNKERRLSKLKINRFVSWSVIYLSGGSEAEYLETSGRVPKWLRWDLKDAREDVEFENYVTLLKEARRQFGRETEGAVILYINKHKGERYCMSCMHRRDKP